MKQNLLQPKGAVGFPNPVSLSLSSVTTKLPLHVYQLVNHQCLTNSQACQGGGIQLPLQEQNTPSVQRGSTCGACNFNTNHKTAAQVCVCVMGQANAARRAPKDESCKDFHLPRHFWHWLVLFEHWFCVTVSAQKVMCSCKCVTPGLQACKAEKQSDGSHTAAGITEPTG